MWNPFKRKVKVAVKTEPVVHTVFPDTQLTFEQWKQQCNVSAIYSKHPEINSPVHKDKNKADKDYTEHITAYEQAQREKELKEREDLIRSHHIKPVYSMDFYSDNNLIKQ